MERKYLKKHKLNSSTGQTGATEWDAADKLNNKSASSNRKYGQLVLGIEGTNNFTTTNRDELKSILFPDNLFRQRSLLQLNDQVDG